MIRAALALLVVGAVSLSAQSRAIKGTVVDDSTGKPIIGARVNLVPDRPMVLTDSLGRYRLDVTGPDSGKITAMAVGYIPAIWSAVLHDSVTVRDFRLHRAPRVYHNIEP